MLVSPGRIGRVGTTSTPRSSGGYDPVTALGNDLYEDWWAEEGVTVASDKVTSWAGRKNGWTLSQTTDSSQPAFGATSFNGKPGITPDGADDCLEAAGVFSLPVGSAGGEIWVLVDQTALVEDASSRTIVMYGNNVNDGRRLVRIVSGAQNKARVQVGAGASSFISTNVAVEFYGRHIVRSIISPTECRVRVDGESAPSPVAGVPATASDRTRFFANATPTASAFGQGVFSRILFTKELSDAKASALLEYLTGYGSIS